MKEFTRGMGPQPNPLREQEREERQAELREEAERDHLAHEASRSKRRRGWLARLFRRSS